MFDDALLTLISALTAGGGAAFYAKWQANMNKDDIKELRKAVNISDDKVDTLGMMMAREYVTKRDLSDLKDDFHKSLNEVREILVRMEHRQDTHLGKLFEKLDKKADK